MKRTLLLLLFLVFAANSVAQKNHSLSETVCSTDGEPLVPATVTIKESNKIGNKINF